jgi:hypothetical protein
MRVNSLVRSLFFAAVISAGFVLAEPLATRFMGLATFVAIYLMGCTIAYAGLIADTTGRAIRNTAVAGAASFVVLMITSGIAGLAVGLAGVLAFVRSGFEFSTRPARAIVVESMLAGLGLAFASWLASPGWPGIALGLWGFALVQSLYFLIPGHGQRISKPGVGDPFDQARDQLLRILEEA